MPHSVIIIALCAIFLALTPAFAKKCEQGKTTTHIASIERISQGFTRDYALWVGANPGQECDVDFIVLDKNPPSPSCAVGKTVTATGTINSGHDFSWIESVTALQCN
jgi:hypothetical protein